MNPFEMVVLIVLLSLVAGVANNYIKSRGEGDSPASDELKQKLAKLDSLDERVRTLEKIVTDRDFELKEKFRNL
jgi:hypothetical protein